MLGKHSIMRCSLGLMWFESLIGSWIGTLDHQLEVPFVGFYIGIEPIGGGVALLEEVCHGGVSLNVYNLAVFPGFPASCA